MAKGDRRGKGRGRPRKAGPRDKNDRLIPETREEKRIPPNQHILAMRKLYSFVTASKGPDGRVGEIDQDVCDGIGKFHALGLLDGHGFEAQDLLDRGREWRNTYVTLLRKQGFKAGGYERTDKSAERIPRHDERFDRMDDALIGYERGALMSLLVDPVVGSWPMGEDDSPWVRSIIAEQLIRRKRMPESCRMPDANDYALLNAAIRGLLVLVDAALPGRFERRAA